MLVFYLCLSFLAHLAMPSSVPPPNDIGLGPGPRGGQLLGEPPGKSEYELKLNPQDKTTIEVYPLDPARAPSRQELNSMSVLLFRNKTEGAIDQVELKPAVPDSTPEVPYYQGRLSTSDSNFVGAELRLSLKDGGEHTFTNGGGEGGGAHGIPPRAFGP